MVYPGSDIAQSQQSVHPCTRSVSFTPYQQFQNYARRLHSRYPCQRPPRRISSCTSAYLSSTSATRPPLTVYPGSPWRLGPIVESSSIPVLRLTLSGAACSSQPTMKSFAISALRSAWNDNPVGSPTALAGAQVGQSSGDDEGCGLDERSVTVLNTC
jgi:hypothetical protein